MDLLSADKYSLCCSERANWPAMSSSKREDKMDEIWDWIYSNCIDNSYFMLLCRERNDYTMFVLGTDRALEDPVTSVTNELAEVLDSRGNWIAADLDEENNTWQLWVNRGGQAAVYLFFDAGGFVIEC